MTIDQMSQALKSVGACFAVTTAKTLLPSDGFDAKPSYHIHPNCSNPRQDDIDRVYSQAQLRDYVQTAKAVKRATSDEKAFDLWMDYQERWVGK